MTGSLQEKPALPPDQKEQARHGERMFPIQNYITVLSDLYPRVTAHWHEEAELTLITEGECAYQIRLDTYPVKKGDLLFLPPAVLHGLSIAPGGHFVSDTYVFHMNFLGTDPSDICAVRYLIPVSRQDLILPHIIKKEHPAYREMLRIFMKLEEIHEAQSPGYELSVKALLLEAVSLLIPYAKKADFRTNPDTVYIEKLKLVMEYIGEHLSEDLTIPRLARLCFFSEYHFMRFFKKYTGISCMEYIKNQRLEHAARLFSQGSSDILEVSMASGFSTLSYFYREFKKKYGMTPKQFMKEKPDYMHTFR